MRADGIVRQVVSGLIGEIHQARGKAIAVAVSALVRAGAVSLTSLGRAMAGRSQKHGIKRADRLLGNRHLATEVTAIYGAVARFVVSPEVRPVILVDWTDTGEDMCTLAAAVPVRGRAITICAVTVPRKEYGARSVENAFLSTLQSLFSPTCKPILVADAGFHTPWMKQVCAMGWDYVARVRGRALVRPVNSDRWQTRAQVCATATRRPRDLGTCELARSRPADVRIVVVDGRSRSARTKPIDRRRKRRALKAAISQREAWCLATSLTLPARKIVKLYKLRMQIELTFRDLKSHRFGWAFEDARSRSAARIAIQLMLAALASLVCMLVGIAAEAAHLNRHFQANTTTKRRVLSLVSLGRVVLRTAKFLNELRLPDPRLHVEIVGIR